MTERTKDRIRPFGLALLVALGFLWTGVAQAADAAATQAEKRAATPPPPDLPVTYGNLYDLEAYWPYHVELTKPWKPEGFAGDHVGHGLGVLIRVERSGDLRVDFGGYGKYLVPARVTNVVEAANRIRKGERGKGKPNFVLAVVNKLVDPSIEPYDYVSPHAVDHIKAYLLVAADPADESFAELAAALQPLGERRDLMLVLLPQGKHRSEAVLEMVRAKGWNHPFAFWRFARSFTESILGEDLTLPTVMLQSPEGRVIYTGDWSEATPEALAKAADRELGALAGPATAAADAERSS